MVPLARFVSQYREYAMTIFHALSPEKGYQIGEKPHPGLIAQFQQGDVSPWEKEAVITSGMPVKGVGHDEDVTRRFSVYDTELQAIYGKWTAEFKQKVEERLRSGMGYGRSYIEVQQPRRPAPWPTYDKLVAQGRRTAEMVAEKIAETVAELGLNAEDVLAYEQENRNRVEVVGALKELGKEEEPEPLVAA